MTWLPTARAALIRAYGRYLARTTTPILVGPYRSEVGFEGLYWTAFLQQFLKQAGIAPSRCVVLTRGGFRGYTGMSYGPDLYSLRSVREVARENLYDQLGSALQKQMAVTEWDRRVLADAAHACGISRYHVLHPAWMYWGLEPWWEEHRGLKYALGLTDYSVPLEKPPVPPGVAVTLPQEFVALSFYQRATFPLNALTQAFVSNLTAIIAQQIPVVLLNTGHGGDDHADIVVQGPNVTVLPKVADELNLWLKLYVMGRARAVVGTYGGVTQTALRMGVPSLSVWQQFGQTAHAHLSLSHFLSNRTGVPFLTGSLQDADLWRQCVSLTAKPAPPVVQGELVAP